MLVRMSSSTPSAWRPEIRRRPTISSARTTPSATIAPTRPGRRWRSPSPQRRATDPVRYAAIRVVACEPTARTTETPSDTL